MRMVAAFAAIFVCVVPIQGRPVRDRDVRSELARHVVEHYARIVLATTEDALAGARALDTAVRDFLEAPTELSLTHARQAWTSARAVYGPTEAYRFYDGPIEAVEGLVNAWPIDENLIDYVQGEPDAGVINRPQQFPNITRELLVSLNEKDGEKSITTGFHAIEFLLWGQDLNANGPGTRSHLDFVDGAAPNAERRRTYLRLVSGLVADNLATVVAEWSPDGEDNYRSRFVSKPTDEALTAMLKGAGILAGAELAGERLTVPYETREQEDEHSCFSDTTHADVIYDVEGIQRIYLGRYARPDGSRIDGPGVRDLLGATDPALSADLERQIASALQAVRAIPAPFDRAIAGIDASPGRLAVRAAIAALRRVSDEIARAGAALHLDLAF